ncbi:hypothetical protein KEM55_004756 [Ascosphaera atra]|nr:hypothetical protein KEM55_004756 [Ascosphaera atra]
MTPEHCSFRPKDCKRRCGGGDTSPSKKVGKEGKKGEKKEEEKGGRVPFNKAQLMDLEGKVKGWPDALREAARKWSGLAEWREFLWVAGEAEELAAWKVALFGGGGGDGD